MDDSLLKSVTELRCPKCGRELFPSSVRRASAWPAIGALISAGLGLYLLSQGRSTAGLILMVAPLAIAFAVDFFRYGFDNGEGGVDGFWGGDGDGNGNGGNGD